MIALNIHGQTLELLPERAVYWRDRQTLLIADPHFGKAAAFRASGIPVPAGTTQDILGRMTRLVEQTDPRRIVFLGDFLHAKSGRAAQTLQAIADWKARHAAIELVLVRGNHDRTAGDPPDALGIRCRNAPLLEAPLALLHHPNEVKGHYSLAGHIHPGALLSGGGRHYERLPCFWFRKNCAVLPAFGEFTGLYLVEPGLADQVFVTVDDAVIQVSE
jgi:uncharacterized protein